MKLYVLSTKEAESMPKQTLGGAEGSWWLRDIDPDGIHAFAVNDAGNLTKFAVYASLFVRPAITLRSGAMDRMIFTERGTVLFGTWNWEQAPMEWIRIGKDVLLMEQPVTPVCFQDKLIFSKGRTTYEDSSLCGTISGWEEHMFSNAELALMKDAPEGILRIDGRRVKLSIARERLKETGLMSEGMEPSEILTVLSPKRLNEILSEREG